MSSTEKASELTRQRLKEIKVEIANARDNFKAADDREERAEWREEIESLKDEQADLKEEEADR